MVLTSSSLGPDRLSECEDVGLGAWLEERDLERPLAHCVVRALELVHAAVPEQAVTVLVDVHAVRGAGSLSVDRHAEGDRLPCSWREHEMRVACVEAVGDA